VGFHISIDRDKCMGSGNCLYWAPGVFDLGDDDVSFVVDAQAASERQIMQAVEGCPTQAITVTKDADGEVPDDDPHGDKD
jgi:ferredoxin